MLGRFDSELFISAMFQAGNCKPYNFKIYKIVEVSYNIPGSTYTFIRNNHNIKL